MPEIVVYHTLWDCPPGASKRQQEHRAGLCLLSRGLADLWGLSIPAEDLPRRLAVGPWGKPCLPDYPQLHFNLSHCRGLAVCAFSPSPVGADVEPVAPCRDRVLPRLLTPSEREFFDAHPRDRDALFARFWTLKESRLKCSGQGLSLPMTAFSLTFPDYPHVGEIRGSEPGFHFAQRLLPGGFVLSVCATAPIQGLRLVP